MPTFLFGRLATVSLAAGLVLGAGIAPLQAQQTSDVAAICASDAAQCLALIASLPLTNQAAIDTALLSAAESSAISDAQLQDIITAFSTRIQQSATLTSDGLQRMRATLARARTASLSRNSPTLNASFAAAANRVDNSRSDSNGRTNENNDNDSGGEESASPNSPQAS